MRLLMDERVEYEVIMSGIMKKNDCFYWKAPCTFIKQPEDFEPKYGGGVFCKNELINITTHKHNNHNKVKISTHLEGDIKKDEGMNIRKYERAKHFKL